jgi:hypothetical protein
MRNGKADRFRTLFIQAGHVQSGYPGDTGELIQTSEDAGQARIEQCGA